MQAASKHENREEYDRIHKELEQEALVSVQLPHEIEPTLVKMATVSPKPIKWLWPGWLPLGKLIVLDGDPNLGKSVLTLDLAARLSRGDEMPDGSKGDVDGPVPVLMISVEDDPEDTIRPRLDAAGADVERVVHMPTVREPPVRKASPMGRERLPSVGDIVALRKAIERTGAKLVIVDPLMAFLPGDAYRDQDVRQALSPLTKLAAELGVTVLVVRHLNKTSSSNAIYRGGGSIGIIGAARVGMLVAQDPDDPSGERRVLATTKSNLARGATRALAYHVEDCDGVARVAWEGTSEHNPTTLLASNSDTEKSFRPVDRAEAFLQGLLAEGPVRTTKVIEKASENGIAERTLERARRKLGVKAFRVDFRGPWMWVLESERSAAGVSQASESANEPAAENVQLTLDVPDDAASSIRRTAPCDHQYSKRPEY